MKIDWVTPDTTIFNRKEEYLWLATSEMVPMAITFICLCDALSLMNRIFHMEFRLLKSCGYHLGCCFLDHVSQRKLAVVSRGSTTERPGDRDGAWGTTTSVSLETETPPHLTSAETSGDTMAKGDI